jgi:hypothetical protein
VHGSPADVLLDASETHEYQKLVGEVMYTTKTHPEIGFAVSLLTRRMATPTDRHLQLVKHVITYLIRVMDDGLVFPADADLKLEAFADSDFAGDKETRRSTSGIVFTLGGGVVYAQCKLQKTVSLSSSEAELKALTEAARHMTWQRRLCVVVNIDVTGPSEIFEDNNGAGALATTNKQYGKRADEARCHWLLLR